MIQNIKINYSRRPINSKLTRRHYYDYQLSKNGVSTLSEADLDDMAIADFSTFDIVNGILYSTKTWKDAINEGVEMKDIGFTGMDNGLIHFQKDRIDNSDFLKLFLDSEYDIPSGDTRLFMTPVTGNTKMFSYPMYYNEDDGYISFKGGFYQGFFQLEGFKYQVLPSKFNHDIVLHFEIRPRSDYEVGLDTVNHLHPENEGIFFFLGTRAENKFWPFYKTDSDTTDSLKKDTARTEGYFDGCGEDEDTYDLQNHVVEESEWLKDEPEEVEPEPEMPGNDGYFAVGDDYFTFTDGDLGKLYDLEDDKIIATSGFVTTYLNTYNFLPNSCCNCAKPGPGPQPIPDCSEYFKDDYFVDDTPCLPDTEKKAIELAYVQSSTTINVDGKGYTDSDGHELTKRGYYSIETDNKFLLFDRTPSGFTTDNWVEGTKVTFEGRQSFPNINYFLIMNHTDTGYTVDTIDKYNEENEIDYNLYKDIRNNVFALKLTEDGAIGYRFGVLDCDDPENTSKYKMVEEYSKPGLVKKDEWNSINIRFMITSPSYNKCDRRKKKMRVMFYVNGFLIFISKELPALEFKALDDVYQKQEAVPYNISLGGGSIGLLETILPDYYHVSDYILPIERDFCGTFLGDIRSFKIYDGPIDYFAIKNYL